MITLKIFLVFCLRLIVNNYGMKVMLKRAPRWTVRRKYESIVQPITLEGQNKIEVNPLPLAPKPKQKNNKKVKTRNRSA